MRRIFAASVLFAAAVPVLAQMPTSPPGAKDKSRVAAGTYTVDPHHTQVLFEVNHLGFNNYFGIFGSPTGSLTIDPAKPSAAKVEISIPLSALVTTSAALNEHLMKPEFFDSAKFPNATFKSTSVAIDKDGDGAKITGDLTIKGVTKPVVLDAEFTGAGIMPNPAGKKATIGFKAETKIKRSDFGVSYGIPLVPDEVPLEITVAFERPAA
ncbi:YceI family protein [Flavisphingomonas formosensis]|uniref:YceI family protein n=1 Tax=Flavisphingomonas formosensis TaxID=861534 RepID=UPI0012F776EF|nr:YceI family protein [Sphingomonas formosensis]